MLSRWLIDMIKNIDKPRKNECDKMTQRVRQNDAGIDGYRKEYK